MPRTIYYVVNANLPHKKAYGIQIAQTCQSFIKRGQRVILITPRGRSRISMRAFYSLDVDIERVEIPVPSAYHLGRAAFAFSSSIFMAASFVYLAIIRLRGRVDCVYTIDMDSFSSTFLPLLRVPVYSEIHATKRATLYTRFFFSRISGVATLNSIVRAQLLESFKLAPAQVIVEPCGVDASWLKHDADKLAARRQLGLAPDARIAAYVGRFYSWKGLEILAPACARMPEIVCFLVGGTKEDFLRIAQDTSLPGTMHFPGECRNSEVPTWLAAADVLLVPWPRQDHFHHLITPMKIFEYMALRRPVVVGDDPTMSSVIGQDEALFYRVGDPEDFVSQVRAAFNSDTQGMVARAYQKAARHTLDGRAERILALMGR